MLKLNRLVIFFIICFTVVCCFGDDSMALSGLMVSPIRSEFEIAPGTQQTAYMNITNESNNTMDVGLSTEAFGVINQQYDYSFTAESDVAGWVNFQESKIQIKPDESRRIAYTIGVPLGFEPGGRYISIFASNDTKSDGDGIVARQRIASLLYITIKGDVTRDGELVSLNAPWLVVDKNNWSATIRNSGTTHFRSRFNTIMTDLFGKNVVGDVMGESMILPGTIKLVNGQGQIPTWPGLYKIKYTIGLGDKPAVVQERYVFYMPRWSIAAILILISVVVFVKKRPKKHQSVCGTAV